MSYKKKCVAIIPARAGSKGIKYKNIIDFCGKPLITWSIEQALSASCVDSVYVSTDGEKIAEVSEKAGANIIWRPDELASDTASSEDALIHAVAEIETVTEIDNVVFLQATSPIRTQYDIDNAMSVFRNEHYDSLFSMSLLEDYCMWKNCDGELISWSYDYTKRGRRQERENIYLENGSIYIFTPKCLRKYHNRLGGKIGMYEMPFDQSYEIDTENDLLRCEYFMKCIVKERNGEK